MTKDPLENYLLWQKQQSRTSLVNILAGLRQMRRALAGHLVCGEMDLPIKEHLVIEVDHIKAILES